MPTELPQASGADLARQALAAARASAKNAPVQASRKTRRTTQTSARSRLGDPQGIAGVLARLTNEQGWDASIGGGNLIDQWPQICPAELATTVRPVGYDAERGILELRPSSPAYATQLRLFQHKLVQHLNGKLGRPAVRGIRVLSVGATAAAVPQPEQPETPAGPVRTRETACAGYQRARALNLEKKLQPPQANSYEEEARQRQIAAARANRLPETEHPDEAERPAGLRPGSMEASEAAARAYARGQRAGRTPRRAFDAA